MATSHQAAIVCQLCSEHSSPTVWKCLDCDTFICTKCKQLHERSKALQVHEIVRISELDPGHRKVRLRKVKCTQHSSVFCLFCCTCSDLVCAQCVSSEHQKHDLRDFNTLYEEHSSELICHVSAIDNVNQDLITKEKEINRILTKEEEKFEKTKTNIIDQRKKIINCVTEIEQKALLDLENNFKTCQTLLQEGKEDIQAKQHKVLHQKQKIHDVLDSHLFEDTLNCVPQTIAIIKSNRNTSDIVLPDLEFRPNNVSTDVLRVMFGTFEDNESSQKSSIKLVPLETYVSPFKFTTTLCIVDKNSAWIICDADNLLMKIKLSYPIKELLKINGGFRDFDLALDGSIIAVYGKPHKNEIYRLRARGKKFEKFIDFSPLFPISIHVENSGDILVGVVESIVGENHFYENRGTNIRQIMKLTPGGKIYNIIKHNKNSENIFLCPVSIKTTEDMIVVLDATSESRKRLIALNDNTKCLWTFNGRTIQKADKPFNPTGMAVSEDGNVILTVLHDHLIIVLDYLGNVILEKNSADLGVCYPLSVTFDSTGILWIGGSIAVDSEKQTGQIHAINYSPEI